MNEVSDVRAALAEFWTLPRDCTPRLVRMVSSSGYVWKAAIIVERDFMKLQQFERDDVDPAKAILNVLADYRQGEEWRQEMRETV